MEGRKFIVVEFVHVSSVIDQIAHHSWDEKKDKDTIDLFKASTSFGLHIIAPAQRAPTTYDKQG